MAHWTPRSPTQACDPRLADISSVGTADLEWRELEAGLGIARAQHGGPAQAQYDWTSIRGRDQVTADQAAHLLYVARESITSLRHSAAKKEGWRSTARMITCG